MNLQHLKIIAIGLALLFACMGCSFYVGASDEYPYYSPYHHHFFEFNLHSSVHQSPPSDRVGSGDMWSRRG